jgi:hypothetical protein
MRGTVLGFDGTTGIVSGEDGKRYRFSAADWKGADSAQANSAVDFVAKGESATEIFPVAAAARGPAASALSGGGAAFIAQRPQLVLAALALLIVLLVPMITYGRLGATALGFPSRIGELDRFSGGLGLIQLLTYTLWIIPVGAGFALFAELTGSRRPRAELVTGIACIATLPIFLIVEAAMPPGVAGLMGFAIGGILLVAIGVGLVLTATGRLTRIPGL